MSKQLKAMLVGAVAALACNLACADSSGHGYVALGLGKANYNGDCTGVTNCEDLSNGSKFYGGYRITPGVAAELVYYNFGKATATMRQTSGAMANIEGHNHALGGGFAFEADLASWLTATARLGLVSMHTEVTGGSGGTYVGTASSSRAKAYVGADLGFVLTKHFSLHAAYDISNAAYDNRRVDLLTVAGAFEF